MIGIGLLRHIANFRHFDIITGTRSTGAGNEVISSLNFKPKFCILFVSDTSSGYRNFSWGIDRLVTNGHFCQWLSENSTTHGWSDGTGSIWIQRDVNNWLRGYLVTPTSVGFTIVWSTLGTAFAQWICLAIG